MEKYADKSLSMVKYTPDFKRNQENKQINFSKKKNRKALGCLWVVKLKFIA